MNTCIIQHLHDSDGTVLCALCNETDLAVRADFDAVMRLYRQLHPDDPAITDGSDRSTFEAIVDDPALHLLVLEEDHRIVATTYLNVIPNLSRSAAPYAVVENVVVDEAHRSRGVGKQIMAATLELAWDAGCYTVMLMTGSKRPSTLGFYRACGFDPDAKSAFLARPRDVDASAYRTSKRQRGPGELASRRSAVSSAQPRASASAT